MTRLGTSLALVSLRANKEYSCGVILDGARTPKLVILNEVKDLNPPTLPLVGFRK